MLLRCRLQFYLKRIGTDRVCSWHVYRYRAQSQLAAGHSAARGVPRAREGQEPHPGQSQQVAPEEGRAAAPPVARRPPGPRRPALRGGGFHPPWPRAGCPHRHAAPQLRDAHRVPPLARAHARRGHGRRPAPRAGLQAGHEPLVAHHHAPRKPRSERRGRGMPCMPRWTGCSNGKPGSSGSWPPGI